MQALLRANEAGGNVTCFFDKVRTETYELQRAQVTKLVKGGVTVYLAEGISIGSEYEAVGRSVSEPFKRGILHSKTFRHGYHYICGSSNWTASSKCNFEQCALVHLTKTGLDAVEAQERILRGVAHPYTDCGPIHGCQVTTLADKAEKPSPAKSALKKFS